MPSMSWNPFHRSQFAVELLVFIDAVSFGLILPVFPFYAKNFGATPMQVGLLISINAMARFLVHPVVGKYSDRLGRRPMLIICQMGNLVGLLTLLFSQSLAWVLAARVIDGFASGTGSIANAYAADISDAKSRVISFGKLLAAFGAGVMLGPALSGWLVSRGNSFPIVAAILVSCLNLMVTYFKLENKEHPGPRPSASRPQVAGASVWLILFGRRTRRVMFQLLIFHFAFWYYFSGLALFLSRYCSYNGALLGPSAVSAVFAYMGGMVVLVQTFILKRAMDLWGESRLMIIAPIFSMLGFLLLNRALDWKLLLLAVPLYCIGNGALRPILMSHLSRDAEPAHLGRTFGVNSSMSSACNIVGGVSGAWIINQGWAMFWPLVPALLYGAIFVTFYWRRRDEPVAKPVQP